MIAGVLNMKIDFITSVRPILEERINGIGSVLGEEKIISERVKPNSFFIRLSAFIIFTAITCIHTLKTW